MARILSVDFDYFQDTQVDLIRSSYPDGIDHPTAMTELIWSLRYGENSALFDVGIHENEFRLMTALLDEQEASVPVMFSRSHVDIVDFINQHFRKEENLELFNVDMHHDIMNGNDCLDCGNWIGKMQTERGNAGHPVTLHWIANPVSVDMYGIGEGEYADEFASFMMDSLAEIQNRKFDLIFFCRSDTWSPPHLDRYFDELLQQCVGKFDTVLAEQSVIQPRNAEAFSVKDAWERAQKKQERGKEEI